eukprot:16436520-Heterocapsa_arctica.AAC.1
MAFNDDTVKSFQTSHLQSLDGCRSVRGSAGLEVKICIGSGKSVLEVNSLHWKWKVRIGSGKSELNVTSLDCK